MKDNIYREKKHRLDSEFYAGERIVSFTLCIWGGNSVFTQDRVFRTFEKILIGELMRFNCEAPVYLFMPDHIHMIISGKDERADLLKFIKMFKQKTGYWFPRNVPAVKWQKDFYDHIIRNNEDLKNQISYILFNPVRKGLVKEWEDYPYKGSTMYNLDEYML